MKGMRCLIVFGRDICNADGFSVGDFEILGCIGFYVVLTTRSDADRHVLLAVNE